MKTQTTHTIDADGQTLGRLATQIAGLLRGKHKPEFEFHKQLGDKVVIKNASKIVVTGKKLTDKIYYRHSGYPGGIKQETLAQKLQKNPDWVIMHAVRGMLPANRLRNSWLKNLTFEN